MIYFTSDTHFGHRKICELSLRPYKSIEEHDEALIANWNATVNDRDEIYHLGDFAFSKGWAQLRGKLNGRIHIIWGNHDRKEQQKKNAHLFETTADLRRIKVQIDGAVQDIVLCHYPMRTWTNAHHGTWHLFGHEHGAFNKYPAFGKSFDVGVDCWGYRPISLAEVRTHMLSIQRGAIPVLHHGVGG